jgi:hypothetical protein
MSISTVTVTWTEQDIGQAPLGGNITFALNEPVSDATSGIDYRPVPKTYFFTSATGESDPLIANDDVTLQPAGSYYTITVAITGQAPYTFTSQILFANGASQTLAYLQANAAVPAAQYQAYLPLPTGTPSAGQVPVVQADGNTQTAWGNGGGGGGGTVDSVTAADASITVGGTGVNPTVKTGRLDQIASLHPPTAAVAMNGQKLTGLGNGSAAADSVAFGQLGSAAFQAASAFDPSGAASTAQSNAEAFAASAVGTETARAEAAEALLAPLAGAAFTGPVSVTQSAAAGGVLTVVNSHTTPTSPTAGYTAQSAADLVLGVSVTGDTVPRLTIDSNGKLAWGPGGSTATDTDLYRNGVATLKTDGALQTGGTLNAANGSLVVSTGAAAFAYASSGGQAVKVTNTTTAPTNPTTQLVAKSAADATLGIQVTGDTQQRILVDSNGKHTWGSGSAAGDVVLQRSSAGVLQLTTGQLSLNSQKITGLANGSASADAVAFGQLGTAAFQATSAFDAAGAAAAAAAASVPLAGGTMTGHLAPAVASLTFGTTIALNAALGNAFALTLTASTGTLSNPANPVDGQTIRVRVIQDATGGRTLAFGTAYDFGAAGAPTLSTAASKVDILGFEYVASLSKWCYLGAGLGF